MGEDSAHFSLRGNICNLSSLPLQSTFYFLVSGGCYRKPSPAHLLAVQYPPTYPQLYPHTLPYPLASPFLTQHWFWLRGRRGENLHRICQLPTDPSNLPTPFMHHAYLLPDRTETTIDYRPPPVAVLEKA